MKKTLGVLLTISLLFNSLFGQTWHRDYAVRSAEKDAENFVLNDIDLKKFKADRSSFRPAPSLPNFRSSLKPGFPFHSDFRKLQDTIDYNADWFKPTKITTPDTLLLKDSIYIQHFRAIAYHKTASKARAVSTLGVVGIVGGGVVVIVGLTAALIAILNHVKI